jgi:hypothetical protein
MPGSMSARSATRSHDSLPPLSRFALPGGGGGERGRREALTAREASARTSDRPLGLTSGSRQEALEAIMQLREGTRRAKVNERQEWRERSKLFQDLWVQRLENTGPGPSQTPRMRGGDRRVAANRAGPWYTAVSLTQGERLKQKRELNWVAGRVSAAQERRAQSKAKGRNKGRSPRGRLQPQPPARAKPDGEDEEGDGPVWTCCSWSPDRRTIVMGAEDSTAVVIDSTSFSVLYKLKGHWSHATKCCTWSPDGLCFCIGAGDSSAVVVEASTGQVLRTIRGVHDQPIQCCCFSPDGSLLCLGAADGTASLVGVHDGAVVHVIKMTDGKAIPVCGFSPDGLIVCLGSDVETALLIDTSTGRPLRRIQDVSGPSMVNSLFLDARLPKQMDFLEALTPPSTAQSSVPRIRPRPAPMTETHSQASFSAAREIAAFVPPETPADFVPQLGDVVALQDDPSVLMSVIKVGADGSYTMFRYATPENPVPKAVGYKTLQRVQEHCMAHEPEQTETEGTAE